MLQEAQQWHNDVWSGGVKNVCALGARCLSYTTGAKGLASNTVDFMMFSLCNAFWENEMELLKTTELRQKAMKGEVSVIPAKAATHSGAFTEDD